VAEKRFAVVVTPEFAARLESVRQASASGDPAARRVFAEAARMLDDLEDGTEKGHHPLTDKSHGGGGDLRDCTASEFRSHPEAKLDHRLIWRQHPAPQENALPIREAVHVGPRHETPDSYEHTLTIIERDPSEQIEANADYGDPAYTGNKSQAVRGSALDAQHAASLMRAGSVPLAKSRPLSEFDFGSRRTTAGRARTLSGRNDGPAKS